MEGKERNGHGTFAFSPLSAVNLARWSFGPAEDDVSLPLAQEGKRIHRPRISRSRASRRGRGAGEDEEEDEGGGGGNLLR